MSKSAVDPRTRFRAFLSSRYSSFAVLYSFQMRNLLKGIGQQMKWSVRDESLHSKMGCRLFRHMCEEYPELKEEARADIEKAASLIVDMELPLPRCIDILPQCIIVPLRL